MGKNLGRKIRDLRTKKLLGLREAARRCDVTGAHLHQVEAGEREPSEALCGRLARQLGGDRLEVCRLAGILPTELYRFALEPDELERLRTRYRKAHPKKKKPEQQKTAGR